MVGAETESAKLGDLVEPREIQPGLGRDWEGWWCGGGGDFLFGEVDKSRFFLWVCKLKMRKCRRVGQS